MLKERGLNEGSDPRKWGLLGAILEVVNPTGLPAFALVQSFQHNSQSDAIKTQARWCHSSVRDPPVTPISFGVKARVFTMTSKSLPDLVLLPLPAQVILLSLLLLLRQPDKLIAGSWNEPGRLAPASGPLGFLLLVPRRLFPQVTAWLSPSLSSNITQCHRSEAFQGLDI